VAPGTLSLFAPEPGACFYDSFENGANQWERDGEWGIVTLPDGGHAMTDSPDGTYHSATPPDLIRVTSITSPPFSLDGCNRPVLTFRHAYVLAWLSLSQDVGVAEISTDGGETWGMLDAYAGGGIYELYEPPRRAQGGLGFVGYREGSIAAPVAQAGGTGEWADATWQTAEISLEEYGGTVRLRFSLAVDQHVADKGWVIDDVVVRADIW
jgi:hypothetical protein